MKHIIALLFVLPLFSAAQECKIKKEVDQFTSEPKLTTGFIPFNEGLDRVLLSIDANSREIDFFFAFNSAGDQKCFDDASTATILYEGTRLKTNFKNTGSMNCEGLFHFTFRNTPTTASALQRLATSKVSTIRLTGSNNKVIDINLKDEEKELLMKMVSCMTQEAKTLLKQS